MTEEMKVASDIDVLVIGGGIAGTFAAIKAKESGAKRVVEVDKGHVGKSGCSAFAAGVFPCYDPEEDDLDDAARRLARSLGHICFQDLIKDHVEQSWARAQDMVSYGVQFERTAEGKLKRVHGRGHYPLLVFSGRHLMDVMRKETLKRGVEQVHHVMITDLLTHDGQVVGAVGFNIRTGDFHVFKSRATVLAAGATWFKGLCPGQRDTTGDGFYSTL